MATTLKNTTNLKVGVVMDPISSIEPAKDTTLAMCLSAGQRGYKLLYTTINELAIKSGEPVAKMQQLVVKDTEKDWYQLQPPQLIPLSELDFILMRKDPPVNQQFLYACQVLDLCEKKGTTVINKPQSLIRFNEKLLTCHFPELCSKSIVSSNILELKAFICSEKDVICKPLDGMGGSKIFRVTANDINQSVILETLTANGSKAIMAQVYIPEITAGDKRVLLINGDPIPMALARIPKMGELRGNLAAGATGKVQPLSKNDLLICEKVAPTLRKYGIYFAGLDIIGNYLTEINITSPTCVRQIQKMYKEDIPGKLYDFIEKKLL